MGKILFILGGARSGKSTYAREYLESKKKPTIFIATALPTDQDMKDRIRNHQMERRKDWHTIEIYRDFKNLKKNSAFIGAQCVLLDCLTLLVSNQMFDSKIDWDHATTEEINELETKILKSINEFLVLNENKDLVIVSNEVGLGIVPDNRWANYFRDILGRINQFIAKKSDNVVFMLAGLPIKIKGEGH